MVKILRYTVVLLGLAIVFLPPASAERPFKTDDPWQVGLYQWETFGGIEVGSGSWNGITGRNQVDIGLGVEYGLTDRSEVGAYLGLYRANDPGAEGVGDGYIHYKHRLNAYEERPTWPDISIDAQLKIPTASRSRNLGTGKSAGGLALLLGWKGDPWTSTARLGYYVSQGWNESSRVEFGVSTRYRLTADADLLGEIYADSNERQGEEDRREVSAGFAFRMFRATTLDLMVTAGLTTSIPDLGVRAGWRTSL